MKIKICPKCGNHNVESSLFCANPACGEALSINNTVELDDSAVRLVPSDVNTSPSNLVDGNPQPVISLPVAPPAQVAPPQPSPRPRTSQADTGKSSCLKLTSGCVVALFVVAVVIAIIAGFASISSGTNIGDSISNMVGVFVSLFGGGLGIFLLFGCSFAPLIFWIWVIIDCVQNEPSNDNDKIVWLLVIFFTNFIGALLYLIIRKPERKRLYGR